MTRQKMIERCWWLVNRIKEAEGSSGLLARFGCGPSGLFSMWPNGMPKGTNDPEFALLQREDVNYAIDQLDQLYEELDQLMDQLKTNAVA